ncbi:MAG: nitrogen fixation protein NifE [Clostridiales bacterium]|jgi:nitrogenase molybdenum-iron protein alpha chain|nr:nitrogen fixation protein NifE [Clostridiales bacterium]MDR2751969.1 nitrogen fixation protein NifE [Clostridiales bacterium]
MPRDYSGIRESRPNTFTDLGGQSEEITEGFNKVCLKAADRTFSQGLQCQQINSISALLSLGSSAFVVHSPQGCAGCLSMFSDMYRVGQAHRGVSLIKSPRVIVTNLDTNDVIHGGEGKLVEAIKLASDRYNPEIIFVFTSCASGIIGDDVDAIVLEQQAKYDSILVPVHCDGFKSKICASGFDAAFIAIQNYLLPKEPQVKQKGLVNLFAPVSISYKDQLEIERMLGLLGVEVNYIPFYSSLSKIRRITSAEASTSICKVFADEFMKTLDEDYGIPFAHTVMPIGVRNTDKWFLGIAELLGKGDLAREYIEKERARVLPQLASIRERLQGKRVFICGGTGRSFAAAALIDDFGMELVGLETPTYDLDAQIDVEYLNGIHGDYVIDVANMQPFEQVNLVNRLKPDVFIGVPSWSARFGIPTTHVLDPKRATMGYDGILFLGNKIAEQVSNPGFNKKLSQYARLPYKKSWYEQDAFQFIKGVGE